MINYQPRKHADPNRLKAATGQRTLIAAAYEAGRMMATAGHAMNDVYPIYWRANLRRAFGDGFRFGHQGGGAPASWVTA